MLKDELKVVIGNKRRYLLLRVADVDAETARKLCHIPKGTYNSWLRNNDFVELHRQIPNWSVEYKQEAIQLLRRANQLSAVLLEENIIAKMQKEIETGDYNLIRTNLARTVYEKLISDLDYQPQAIALSWEQRLQQIFTNQPQIEGSSIEGEVIREEVLEIGEVSNGNNDSTSSR